MIEVGKKHEADCYDDLQSEMNIIALCRPYSNVMRDMTNETLRNPIARLQAYITLELFLISSNKEYQIGCIDTNIEAEALRREMTRRGLLD